MKDPNAVRLALQKIEDGKIFENFAQSFLSSRLGYRFISAGGIKDRGIDGFEYSLYRESHTKIIYQISISKQPNYKLRESLEKLQRNEIEYDKLVFVSNQLIKDKDLIINDLLEQYKAHVDIWDIDWFVSNVNNSHGTISAFHIFVESHLHEYTKPGKGMKIHDLLSDPRLFVFLRQQWDAHHAQKSLADLVIDSLILYGLEGTDPDHKKLRSKEDLKNHIHSKLKFTPKIMDSERLDARLKHLSKKPDKKINYHTKENKFCLPFETRTELIDKNLKDEELHETFQKETLENLNKYLKLKGVRVEDTYSLIELVLNKIFYKQGLEFSDLVNSKDYKDSFSKSLPDIIDETINESSVIVKNRTLVREALLVTIRNMIYNGTPNQKKFLKKLSNTYMLLFTLQCEPNVAVYFESMANKLNLYVGNSILIPALSEMFLEKQNRRYCGLLKGATRAGVKLNTNDTIIDELVAHIRKIKSMYEDEFSDTESIYDSELAISNIQEIILKSYFYAHSKGKIDSFNQYLDSFCNPSLSNLKQDMIDFLKEEFSINHETDDYSNIKIDNDEYNTLTQALSEFKGGIKAEKDAKLILTIYAIREKKNESAEAGVYGFNTWWLSTDTTTRKVVKRIFEDKYPLSCYMRPDFLYNYISLSPSVTSVDNVYKELFPGLLGVNISNNIPKDISNLIRKAVSEHKDKNPGRLRSAVREMVDKLKSEPGSFSASKIKSFFQDKLG